MKPNIKPKIKMGMDILMTALLLGLMGYQITGQLFHEWFGAWLRGCSVNYREAENGPACRCGFCGWQQC